MGCDEKKAESKEWEVIRRNWE